jgi:hypothetical protein
VLGAPPTKAREFIDKAGEWAETPLVESALGFHEPVMTRRFPTGTNMATFEDVEAGLAKGAYKFGAQLTTPENLAFMAATGIAGGVEKAGAAWMIENAPRYAKAFSVALDTIKAASAFGFSQAQLAHAAQTIPAFNQACRNGDVEGAVNLAMQGSLLTAAGLLSAGYGVKVVRGENLPIAPEHRVIGKFQKEVEIGNIKANNFERANAGLMKDRPLDLAGLLWHEVGGNPDTLGEWQGEIRVSDKAKPQVKQKFIGALERAKRLPQEHPEVVRLGEQLQKDYAEDWAKAKEANKIAPDRPGVERYGGRHIYSPEDATESTVKAPRQITKKPGIMKERVFDNLKDAIVAGYEPHENIGLAERRGAYIREHAVMMGAIGAEDEMMAKSAPDGRPLAISPAKVRQIGAKRVMPIAQDTDLTGIDPNLIIEKDGKKFLDISDYRNASERGPFNRYKVIATDSEGEPVYQRAPVALHPDIQPAISKAFEESSWLRKIPLFNAALKVSSTAKQTLLELSPFHMITSGLRGYQMGLQPWELFHPPELDINSDAVTKGTETGLTLTGDSQARSAFMEGVTSGGGLLSKVPVIGNWLDGYSRWLFDSYIPRLKAATWPKIVKQLEKDYPAWSDERRYTLAGKMVNNAFGKLNYRQLGVSMTGLDIARLLFLAPDFEGGSLLFLKQGFEPGGKIVWNSFARILVANALLAQFANTLITGTPQLERPLEVVNPWDKSKSISIRTLPEDLYKAATNPREFTANRLNPTTVRTLMEWGTGKNLRGESVTGEQEVYDALRNITPLAAQNFIPHLQYPGESPVEGIMRAGGFKVTQDISPALDLARKLASNRGESGPVDADKLKHHQFKIQLEDSLRRGQMDPDILPDLVDQGSLSELERKQLEKSLRATEGMEPGTAQLYSRVRRLPMADSLQIWDLATNDEREALYELMHQKKLRYLKDSQKKMTALERERDPVWQKIQDAEF